MVSASFRRRQRARKIGIVALERRLFVLLWRYLETGQLPAGVKAYTWQSKLGGQRQALA